MTGQSVAVVTLAAGQGTRMKSALPKVLHEIGGRSMLAHVLSSAKRLAPSRLCLVVGDGGEAVAAAARAIDDKIAVAVQSPPQGTGDAVAKALPDLAGFDGVVLVLFADTPLVAASTMQALAEAARGRAGAVLGFRAFDPGAYGRLVLDTEERLERIVEARDAAPDELSIDLCNSGVMAVDASFLREALPKLSNDNAKGEYYLTDLIAMARAAGQTFAVVESDEDEVLGVNSRSELAEAEAIYQDARRQAAMEAGATLIDPSTVYFSYDTEIGKDTVIEPNAWFGRGVRIGEGVRIKTFTHVEGASIAPGAVVGPFARLRPGADIGPDARVGNFVEVKKAQIGAGAKVNHLAYIGDATIGPRANIGAGTITCNYDGFRKYKTEIGEDAFIGSNSALVAPVSIGAGAYVGSGSVITKNVEKGALAVARGRQAEISGWAARFKKAMSRPRDKDT